MSVSQVLIAPSPANSTSAESASIVPVSTVPAYWLRSFALQLTVQSAELDELGHVNNVVYLGWIEQVARAHADAVGAGFAAMAALGVVARMPAAEGSAPLDAPVLWPMLP